MSVYLKSLEISGFKSFGTRTYLEFSEGITGIVGPNGCGKSNVVESMKWVLGEQSAKSLRGEKMQDIIFAGTKHRSASGMADVSLTFNNELKWLPLEFEEVSIGRRSFRSGEGQYFVNGVRSRLKDTTELFLDTGVGRDSYAIFEQGKIDRLLSESAEDRRILFEDFAGISKFKFRKEEAEKKLAQARENLERLQETIDRLEKEIASLEIQAQDAENYNALNAELREMEIKFEVSRVANMRREIQKRESEIIKLKEALAPMSDKLNELEEQIKLSDESLGEKEKVFGQMNQKNVSLEKELIEVKTRYESTKKNHAEALVRMAQMDLREKQDKDRLEEFHDIIEEKQDAVSEAEKKQAQAKKTLDEAESVQNSIKTQISSLEEKLLLSSNDMGFKKVVSRDDSDNLRKQMSELQGQLYMFESTMLSLEEEVNTKAHLLKEENIELQKLAQDLTKAQEEKELISIEKNKATQEVQKIETVIANLDQEYKKTLDLSKECDKNILSKMDLQITKLKEFQKGHQGRTDQLSQIMSKTQDIVAKGQLVSPDLFEELYRTMETHEDAYTKLLEDIFGEGGAFSEKIAYSEQMDKISEQLDQEKSMLNTARKELDAIVIKESSTLQKGAEVELLYKASERECLKTEKGIASAKQNLVEATGNFDHTKSQIITNTSKLEKIDALLSNYDKDLSSLRNQNFQLQEDLTHARVNYNGAETQTRALGSDIKSLEERINDLQKQMNSLDGEKSQNKKSIADLAEEMEDLLIDQDELSPELARLQENMKQHFNEIADIKESRKIIEQMHKDGIEQFTKLRMRESEIEGALSERTATLENMRTAFSEQFNIKEDEVVLSEEDTTENLNYQIRLYRDRLNLMGNVNLLAIDQFHSVKEQHGTLIYHRDDIEAAANDTEILINDTNKESAERFLVAFEQISKSFRALFSELFNGGRADLILKDRDDPLRSGIDIMAEPPGQKFQNVSLLSGGQRAMVAIAVIFSILELKPTPFVILDEMDAPLDDENIDRFKRLLVRFKGTSQFIVVSHSKSTLEVCDVLFGVTMEELGCSKIVSVAFDDTDNLLFT